MIFWIAVTVFLIVGGQDVSFQYDNCYSEDEGIVMTATYTGSGTVTAVQWYYSGNTGSNLLVAAATCIVVGSIPQGYPDASQMSFDCPSTNSALQPNTFKLTVTGLQEGELENSWGATFVLTSGSLPAVTGSSFSVCVGGQDVSFQYDNCYSEDEGIVMTATYTGSGTVTAVQWYYSGKTGNNLLVLAATCLVAGSIPQGYPDASQMSFDCPSTNSALQPNTFKLTVTGLQEGELENSWGATFSLTSGSLPAVTGSSFSVCVGGQDVSFQYDNCYSEDEGIAMTATYTGSGTVTAVQWYYSGETGSNLFVAAATCIVVGSIPPGYPDASQMSFGCPSTNSALQPNTFKLTVTGLQGVELDNSWGATFSLTSGSPPAVTESSFSVCGSTSTRNNTTNTAGVDDHSLAFLLVWILPLFLSF